MTPIMAILIEAALFRSFSLGVCIFFHLFFVGVIVLAVPLPFEVESIEGEEAE